MIKYQQNLWECVPSVWSGSETSSKKEEANTHTQVDHRVYVREQSAEREKKNVLNWKLSRCTMFSVDFKNVVHLFPLYLLLFRIQLFNIILLLLVELLLLLPLFPFFAHSLFVFSHIFCWPSLCAQFLLTGLCSVNIVHPLFRMAFA